MRSNKPALLFYGLGSLISLIIAFIFYLKIEALGQNIPVDKMIVLAVPGIVFLLVGIFCLYCFANLLFKTIFPQTSDDD